MEIIFIIGLIALMALNAYASHQCFRDNFSSREQRLAQIAFIWIVPFWGGALALRLSRNEPEQSSGIYREALIVADEYVTGFGRQNSRGYTSSPDDNFHSVGGVMLHQIKLTPNPAINPDHTKRGWLAPR